MQGTGNLNRREEKDEEEKMRKVEKWVLIDTFL